jgi:hypothetical protein
MYRAFVGMLQLDSTLVTQKKRNKKQANQVKPPGPVYKKRVFGGVISSKLPPVALRTFGSVNHTQDGSA